MRNMRRALQGAGSALALIFVGCGDGGDSSANLDIPAFPVEIEALSVSGGSVQVKTTGALPAGRNFIVERSLDAAAFGPVGALSGGAFTDTLLPKGAQVRYRLTEHLTSGMDLYSNTATAVTSWSRTYGGTDSEKAFAFCPCPDGGFLVIGDSETFGAGRIDAWIMKIDATGELQWSRTLGGPESDWINFGRPTPDGGFILVGEWGYDWSQLDAWVVKLNADGSTAWDVKYGTTSGTERAYGIEPTDDGGYMLAGTRTDVPKYDFDVWLVKLGANGDIERQQACGGPAHDKAMRFTMQMAPTADGGYLLTCSTASWGAGWWDFWVLKFDAAGALVGQNTIGGAGYDAAKVTVRHPQGGFLVGGFSSSFGDGSDDYWVLRLDDEGNILWQKTYGGPGEEWLYWIEPLAEGGCLVAGTTTSFGAGAHDYWILKLDEAGEIVWQRTYGGALDEDTLAMMVRRTSDQGFLCVGRCESAATGPADAWVFKMAADGSIDFAPDSGLVSSQTHVAPGISTAVFVPTNARVWTTSEFKQATGSVSVQTTPAVRRQ